MTAPLGMLGPTGHASGLKGTGYKQLSMPSQNANQAQLTQMLHGLLGSGGFEKGLGDLSSMAGGDQSKFAEMEAPALRQHSALMGNIASRFSGMGSGSRNSSGFQNTVGNASTDLAERLQGNRMGYQQQALSQLLGLSDSLLNRSTEDSFLSPQKRKKKWWEHLLGGSFPLAGGIGGALLGGPFGATLGSQLGSGLGNAFLGD